MSQRATLATPAPDRPAALAAGPTALAPAAPRGERRLLGRVQGSAPGPTLVIVGGMHGNEPSGVAALERVLAALRDKEGALRGELVALAGNLDALAGGLRYVERDLNRCWTVERVAELRRRDAAELTTEDREQIELLAEIEAAFARSRGTTFVLDMHSTSGGGAPFVVLDDTLPNRRFASLLPVPVVLGLEEELSGTLLDYMSGRGHVTIAFESGQHDAAASVDHAEAAVWLALEAAGLVSSPGLSPPRQRVAQLRAAAAGLPRFVEVRHRHAIEPGDGFQMEPGFASFQPVEEGQLLARDRHGEIRAPQSGRVLMPLYQPQGEDGFFIVRGFSPAWIALSSGLRRLAADRIVHWLPGVRRHPELPATYLVDRRVARWYALEILHLLGFRRRAAAGDELVVSRRSQDLPAAPRRA